jgi:plastocyanin
VVVLILALGAMAVVYVNSTQGSADQIAQLSSKIDQLASNQKNLSNSILSLGSSLPVMNQAPTVRHVRIEWAEYQSGQDRFNSPLIVVNQGDTVAITYVSNDTDAHTVTIGPPYNFQINGSVPGTQNFLKNEKTFTTQPTHNSPGVQVSGRAGSVTGFGSFVAAHAGIYEYYCVYHVQLGMFGYLVVLPNAAASQTSQNVSTSTSASPGTTIDIEPGSYNVNQTRNFVPDTVVVVIGVNNTVTWVNDDIAPHTVTSTTGAFNSGNISPGTGWAYTFTAPGTYTYFCSYHTWMKGTVVVEAAA